MIFYDPQSVGCGDCANYGPPPALRMAVDALFNLSYFPALFGFVIGAVGLFLIVQKYRGL